MLLPGRGREGYAGPTVRKQAATAARATGPAFTLQGSFMDSGTLLALAGGYIAAGIGVFLLYSPVFVLFVGLLLAAGLLQLLAWPVVVLVRKLRRRHDPPQDSSWLLH